MSYIIEQYAVRSERSRKAATDDLEEALDTFSKWVAEYQEDRCAIFVTEPVHPMFIHQIAYWGGLSFKMRH